MPRYIAVNDTWLSHECRMVKAGDTFDTTFPDVEVTVEVNGKKERQKQPMRLGDNLKLVEAETEVKGGKKKPAADDLV